MVDGGLLAFSLVAIASMLLGLLFSPLLGVIADNYDKKIVINIACLLFILAILFLLVGINTISNHVIIAILVVSMINIIDSMEQPALSASIPMIVEREYLSQFNAINESLRSASLILTPFIGALLIELQSMTAIIYLCLFLVSIAVVVLHYTQKLPPGSNQSGRRGLLKTNAFDQISEAWMFIRTKKGLVSLLVLFVMLNLITSVFQVLLIPLSLNYGDVYDASLFRTSMA